MVKLNSLLKLRYTQKNMISFTFIHHFQCQKDINNGREKRRDYNKLIYEVCNLTKSNHHKATLYSHNYYLPFMHPNMNQY
jgi:hypothetical protein